MLRSLLLVVITLVLAACGGGGGATATIEAQDSVAIFSDSYLKNIKYKRYKSDGVTVIKSGVTGSQGEFSYKNGEKIVFQIYSNFLPAVNMYTGTSQVTPLDLITTDTFSSTKPDFAINLMRFLQTFDDDGNPSVNGIQLIQQTAQCEVDFYKTIEDFSSDACLIIRLTESSRALVSIQNAITHFAQESISKYNNQTLSGLSSATSKITNTKCSNNLELGWAYSFDSTRVTAVGDDSFVSNGNNSGVTCTGGGSQTLSVSYSAMSNEEIFYCLPNCLLSDLNRVWVGVDSDGRTHISIVWHQMNSKIISYYKRIINDPINGNLPAALTTFREVITLN